MTSHLCSAKVPETLANCLLKDKCLGNSWNKSLEGPRRRCYKMWNIRAEKIPTWWDMSHHCNLKLLFILSDKSVMDMWADPKYISHSQVLFAHSHFHGIRGCKCTLHSSIFGFVLGLETCLASDLPLVNMPLKHSGGKDIWFEFAWEGGYSRVIRRKTTTGTQKLLVHPGRVFFHIGNSWHQMGLDLIAIVQTIEC